MDARLSVRIGHTYSPACCWSFFLWPDPPQPPLFQIHEQFLNYNLKYRVQLATMVDLEVVRACNAALVKSQPLVAVFTGSTSGIGSYAVKALAKQARDGPGLRLYMVGRNKDAADRILSECQKHCPEGQFRFLQAGNLALLKDVDRVCEEIVAAEQKEAGTASAKPRIDLLIMTHAYLSFDGRHGKSPLQARDCGLTRR